jgi:DNA-binding NarL/FixJ family response regulator
VELLLVDPSPIFRAGLKAAIAEVPGADELTVVAECADGAGGARLAAALVPDLVVSDIHLGASNGIELAQELRRIAPSVRVLILASNGSEAIVHQALVAGAAGYVLKGETGLAVVAAIRSVGRGELVLPPGVSVRARRAAGATDGTAPDELVRLSQRERQIFDLVVWGNSNKQIATRIGIGIKTVETHRGHINGKLRVHTTADIVRLASLLGMLVPAPAQGARVGSNGVSPQ